MLDDPNAHFNKTPEDDKAYKAEFGELGPADISDEELNAFFRCKTQAHWFVYLKGRFPDDPVKQLNFFAAALAAVQRGPAEGTAPEWWQHAGNAGRTVTNLFWELLQGYQYKGTDLGKWFPSNREDAGAMLDKLPDLSNAAWRLLRLIVHYGCCRDTERGLKFDTLSLMDSDGLVAAYYNAVYNNRGPLLPLPGAKHSEEGKLGATGRRCPNRSYRLELLSWLCSFKPSDYDKRRHLIDPSMLMVADDLYAEGIRPIVVEYWGGSRAEYYDHTNIRNKGRVRSLQFSNYPFLNRLNLDAEGYVNLVEIFVDGVVTKLPNGATDGSIRVIHGVRPCDHCSWMGSLRTQRLWEYNPLYHVWEMIRHDVSTFIIDKFGLPKKRVWAAYIPVLTAAGYDAMLALLRPVPDTQKENYNRARPDGITIFPSKGQQKTSVFEQIGQEGRRFDVRASILNEPTVTDVARGIQNHLSGFVVSYPREQCGHKPREVIISQDLLTRYPLALPGTQLWLRETLDNRFALDHLAIHLSGWSMNSLTDPADSADSPFSYKYHEKFRKEFKSTLVLFGASEIMAVPKSFVKVRQQLELNPGVVNCVEFARRIALDAVKVAPESAAPAVPAGDVSEPADADAAADPAGPDVRWREAMRIASAAGLGLGRHYVFPAALVAFVADKIKTEFSPRQLNSIGQWWLASQVAVALGSSNYKKNEKFGNDVVACIKDESWFDRAVG
jgi:hypothetical protein